MLRRFNDGDFFGPIFSKRDGQRQSGFVSSQVTSFTSYTDADGKVHTEKYASAVDEDFGRGIREARHAYANSKTGEQKAAHERQLMERGKKVVMSRRGHEDAIETSNFFQGFEEMNAGRFEDDWLAMAAPFMPRRGNLDPATLDDVRRPRQLQ